MATCSLGMKIYKELYELLNTEITSEIVLKIITLLDSDLDNVIFNKIYELVITFTHFKDRNLIVEARQLLEGYFEFEYQCRNNTLELVFSLWCVVMSVYGEILTLVNKSVISNHVIFTAIGLLDDYSCNSVHDEIFDLLFEFLVSKNVVLLERVKQICLDNIRK